MAVPNRGRAPKPSSPQAEAARAKARSLIFSSTPGRRRLRNLELRVPQPGPNGEYEYTETGDFAHHSTLKVDLLEPMMDKATTLQKLASQAQEEGDADQVLSAALAVVEAVVVLTEEEGGPGNEVPVFEAMDLEQVKQMGIAGWFHQLSHWASQFMVNRRMPGMAPPPWDIAGKGPLQQLFTALLAQGHASPTKLVLAALNELAKASAETSGKPPRTFTTEHVEEVLGANKAQAEGVPSPSSLMATSS